MKDDVILKECHDDDFTFYKDNKIPFGVCTPERKLTFSELLRFTSDAAGEDFTLRNMSWSFLKEKGLVFIISRISYHFYKHPQADQLITLKTWESAAQGPLATRNYEIYDSETKELLIKGQTLWTVLDIANQRLMPAKAFSLRPTPTNVCDYEFYKPGKISIPEDIQTIATRTVLYSDTDANGHTNNSKYINFVMDALPPEYRTKAFTDLRLNYSKEAKLGDTLEIKAKFDENKITAQGVVDGVSSFECELYF